MCIAETSTELATGTAFIYQHEDIYYLVTNGHNFTGVDPNTQKRLSSIHAGFPDLIKLRFRRKHEDSWFVPVDFDLLPLYEDDEKFQPRWFIHPKHGYEIDVVVLPITTKTDVPNHVGIFPINQTFDVGIPVVSDDVFILGYPVNISGTAEMPIWKRGSIATEPSFDLDNLPKFLVDTATRSGMSGSPVIMQRHGVHFMEDGKITHDTTLGTIRAFVGIYSGRLGAKDEFQAQLGIVWKKQVIEEIIEGQVKSNVDFQRIG